MYQEEHEVPDWVTKLSANKKKLDEALGRQKTAHKNCMLFSFEMFALIH